jgi:hypothetical protein
MRELLVALAPANEQTISDRDLRYITSFADSLGIALTSIVQRFSFWTVVGIFLGLIAERISGEESSCLVLTIDDRNVGLNIPL